MRLFDSKGESVDYVKYNDKEPWPVEADGEGQTLSLINPVLDNEKAESWASSRNKGTPGKKNDVYEVGIDDHTPPGFSLGGNYPNPFNPVTTIPFSIQESSHVTLTVYDVTGRAVVRLVDGVRTAGTHSTIFDASNLASGIYLYRLEAGDFNATGKMVLMK